MGNNRRELAEFIRDDGLRGLLAKAGAAPKPRVPSANIQHQSSKNSYI